MEHYTQQAAKLMAQLLAEARLAPGDIVVVGCSTSEITGHRIGTAPGPEIGAALLKGFLPPLADTGLFLAVQCCEHLERALVVEQEALRLHRLEQVNAVPQPKAGGSLATAAWQAFRRPILANTVKAAAGIDIGGTLIGMHLRPVAVPLRLQQTHIGEATVRAARTRPRFVGGARAVYDSKLL